MAKKDAVQAETNELMEFFSQHESDFQAPREYDCPDFNRKFYFLHASLAVDEAANSKQHFKTISEQMAANYWSVACDAEGNRFVTNHPRLKKAVADSMKKRGFRRHCVRALNFLGDIPKNTSDGNDYNDAFDDSHVVDSEIEGSLDNEKKPSSSPVPEGS